MHPHFGFPGRELAVVGVREGGAGHGLLLCHFHRQLHGPELRQAPAAAEALGGENQVMTRQSGTNIQVTVFVLLLLRALRSAPATHNLTTNLTPIHSQRLNAPPPSLPKKNKNKTGTICWCECVCVLLRTYVLFTVCPSSGFVVLPLISLSRCV